MIRAAARLLNAKMALDPLVARLGKSTSESAATWLEMFSDDVHTVDRAVNSLLYTGPRLSEHNCRAAADMAEKLVGVAEYAASMRSVGPCGVDGCDIRGRHRHEPIEVRGGSR